MAEVADLLDAPRPFVTLIHYRLPGLQTQMYLHFIEDHARQTEWFILLDADEFIHARDHDIARLLRRHAPGRDCVYLHWMLYGPCGHAERPAGGVLRTHVRRAARFDHHPKSFMRAAVAMGLGMRLRLELHAVPFWHFWDAFLPPGRAVNVLGEDYGDYSVEWLSDRRLAILHDEGWTAAMLAEGYVAHFMIKSEQDFARRVARGATGDFRAQAAWRADADHGVESMNAVVDERFARWRAQADVRSEAVGGRRQGVAAEFPAYAPGGRNLAREGRARQSSLLYAHLAAARGADGGCAPSDGPITGYEASAWWEVALDARCAVSDIVVFGGRSLLTPDPGWFEITLFVGGRAAVAYRSATAEVFSGVEQAPFRLAISPAAAADRVRLTRLDPGFLHFAEFEVWGSYN